MNRENYFLFDRKILVWFISVILTVLVFVFTIVYHEYILYNQ